MKETEKEQKEKRGTKAHPDHPPRRQLRNYEAGMA